MAATEDVIGTLASLALFADLSRAQLDSVAHRMDEEWFADGQRIVRQGFSGTGFYVILDGDAVVRIDGQDRARLSRGDFFGELSILLDEPPVGDVVALQPLHCLVLPRAELSDWLMAMPSVAFRMLQAEARRLRAASQWRS
ncbi:MAG TPA: cyclic nucleotide-binding domain-containing protein [Egibacteraceae bacterium]|nr:cyclic nucleotide-binding domain-containing protein [Egibacteraceae bacterium]